LGMTFPNDDARREYFLQRLREHLQDPEFRKIEGFPIGEDEDILALSDPPYYTACPNPFIRDFIKHYGKPYDPDETYRREPFAVDVSVGKTDQLYRAHGYHTKVPHLAIVPSILHYTKPGDIVLDGFCGSGMTGVAAQWCGTAPQSYRQTIEHDWKTRGKEAPAWGARRVILNDLSPAATFISANYNIPFDVDEFSKAARQLLDELDNEIGWMYETLHTDGITKGRINFTVWSEVFVCPECSGQVIFLQEALDTTTKRVRDVFPCPTCKAQLSKKRMERYFETQVDSANGQPRKVTRRVPVLINYANGMSIAEKTPDSTDHEVLEHIYELDWPAEIPIDRMMHAPDDVDSWGDRWRSGTASFTHVHHLFLLREAQALASMWRKAQDQPERRIRNM